MKNVNLFTSNLSGRQLIAEKSASKKEVRAALADFGRAIDGAFAAVIKSPERRARNVANAAKGKYRTAAMVVANCYPYQTTDGVLCAKQVIRDADGNIAGRVWAAKKLTASAARGIVRAALNNFIASVGAPEIVRVEVGAPVE